MDWQNRSKACTFQTFPEGVRLPHLEFELCKLDVNRPFSTHSGIDVTYCSIKLADVAELADAQD